MLYMVIERFKLGPEPVGVRFRERGRMMPEGLRYVASWLEPEGERCFQVMETEDKRLIDAWMANWGDLMDFEIVPVLASADFWANR